MREKTVSAKASLGGKKIIHRHRPTGNGGLGGGDLPAPVDGCGMVSVAIAVDADHVVAQQVHVPNDERAGSEVIGALGEHLALGGGAVVALATNFNSEYRCLWIKLHTRPTTRVESDIGTERLAVRKFNKESFAIAHRSTCLSPAGVQV